MLATELSSNGVITGEEAKAYAAGPRTSAALRHALNSILYGNRLFILCSPDPSFCRRIPLWLLPACGPFPDSAGTFIVSCVVGNHGQLALFHYYTLSTAVRLMIRNAFPYYTLSSAARLMIRNAFPYYILSPEAWLMITNMFPYYITTMRD